MGGDRVGGGAARRASGRRESESEPLGGERLGAKVGASLGLGDHEAGRVGPFPSWRWVYGSVLVYGVVVIGILTFLTRAMNVGAR